jgi:glycosyltransferase involved in cell wall biosynthesis
MPSQEVSVPDSRGEFQALAAPAAEPLAEHREQVLVLGLDTFARKNVLQIQALEADDYAFTVVTNDRRGDSERVFDSEGFRLSRLATYSGIISKLWGVSRMLYRARFHHVELYAAGRLTLLYLAMLMVTRQRIVVIERGDIGCLRDYGPLIRLILKLAYRLAVGIIYKETYMRELLEGQTRAPLFFVPNSRNLPQKVGSTPRAIDFLWVNRITLQRRCEWLVKAMGEEALKSRSAVVLGFEDRHNLHPDVRHQQERVRRETSSNIELYGFVGPDDFYQRARFFCLPSELVFGNNSLLEAMSWGVVPIVTDAPGVELIVRDGVNGIVTPFSEEGYKQGLLRALALSEAAWTELSEAARATIAQEYSSDVWRTRMIDAYQQLGRL